jgi:hypothetical protein
MGINSVNAQNQAIYTAPIITQTINTQTGTTYTPVASDAASVVLMNNASANTFYIPTNASVGYAIGTALNVVQYGAGSTTIQASNSGTTTIYCNGSNNNNTASPVFRGRYSAATCLKIATDTWLVAGDVY